MKEVSTKDGPPTDTIAQMISIAEKQAADAAAEEEEARDIDTHTNATEMLSQESDSPSRGLDSPPIIVRNSQFSPERSAPLSPRSTVTDDSHQQLRVCTSNLSMNDNTVSRRDHYETMEGTLDTLMSKIEECTAILQDPSSSVEEQIEAAALAAQYAKAAKAFHTACSP